jgi:hypothetical protein
VTAALSPSGSGKLMPFGGQYSTCVAVVNVAGTSRLQVADCSNASTFFVDGGQLKTSLSPELCVDIEYGTLVQPDGGQAFGKLGVVGCNKGINQAWRFGDGNIVSLNLSQNQPYCIDVLFGNTSIGSELGVAPCNGTAAQAIWMAGFTMSIQSSLRQGCSPQCVDVLFGNLVVNQALDNWICNGGGAQRWVFDTLNRIQVASAPTLCVGLSGSAPNPQAVLKTCNTTDQTQRWYLTNTLNDKVGIKTMSSTYPNTCLDVLNGDATPGVLVKGFTCNATPASPAQRFSPQLVTPSCGAEFN